MNASRKAVQIELGDHPVIRVWAHFFHSLCRAMYHIVNANKMVQKHLRSCYTGSLDQRNIWGISARDMKGKRQFRLVLLVARIYHHIDSMSRTSCQ